MRPDSRDDLGADEPRPGGPTDEGSSASAAGPVAGEAPSPSQATGEGPTPTPPTGDTSKTADEAIEKDLDALFADTQRERDEYLDLAKRTKADFENYRRRMAAEVQAATNRGKAELVRELIDSLDNLERALHAVGIDADKAAPLIEETDEATSDKVPDGFEHGVLLVFHGLRETLLRTGIEPVDPTGEKFDPNLHEALSTEQVVGVGAGTVLKTVQKGYKLGEQLIRPARVVVAE